MKTKPQPDPLPTRKEDRSAEQNARGEGSREKPRRDSQGLEDEIITDSLLLEIKTASQLPAHQGVW